MQEQKEIILASSSPARRMLMERLLLPFSSVFPDIDETPKQGEKLTDMVVRLAIEKASVFAERYANALIIGVDLAGELENEILGKPITHENAVKQLMNMSGKQVNFYIGLCVLDTKSKRLETSLERFDVIFRALTLPMIERYLQKEPALQCAGSLQVEGLGIVLLEKLIGDDYTALIGLPLIRLSQLLRNFGVDLP